MELDGTEKKCTLSANAIPGVSMAICRAGAAEKGRRSLLWLRIQI